MYSPKSEAVKIFNRILLILTICYACFSAIILVRILHAYLLFSPGKGQWNPAWDYVFNGQTLDQTKWAVRQIHNYLYYSVASWKHLIFFYLLFSCSIGLPSLVVLILANLKSRRKASTYLIYFLSAKTAQLIFLSFLEYQQVNIPFGFSIYQNMIAYSLESMAILFLPHLVNELFTVIYRRQINYVFNVLFVIGLILISMPYFLGIYGKSYSIAYLHEVFSIKILTSFKIYRVIFWSAYLYAFLVAILKIKTIKKGEEKFFDIHFMTILLVFACHSILPVIFFPENMLIFAVGYFSLNMLLLKYMGNRFFDFKLFSTHLLPGETVNAIKLTDREKEILIFLELGLTNKNIGDKLYISETTVKTHLKNIYHKFEVNSRTQLLYILRNSNVCDIK